MKVAPTPQHYWDLRAAGNFILGGAGSASIAWASLALWFTGVHPAALPLGAALVAGGLLLVWFEIGRPERFLNVLRNPRTSWMSREAWAALALLPLTGLASIAGSSLVALPAGLLALAFLYCQAHILRASRGIPAWRQPQIVALVIATGLVEGGALYLLLHPSTGGVVAACGALLLLARLICWRRFAGILGRAVPDASRRVLGRFDIPFVLAGHLLPLAAGVGAWLLTSVMLAALAAVSALLSGWAMKYLLVTRAAHTQGFAIARTPSRGAARGGAGVGPGWSR